MTSDYDPALARSHAAFVCCQPVTHYHVNVLKGLDRRARDFFVLVLWATRKQHWLSGFDQEKVGCIGPEMIHHYEYCFSTTFKIYMASTGPPAYSDTPASVTVFLDKKKDILVLKMTG